MRGKLLFQGLIKYIAGILIVGLMVFLPAGTFDYVNGWGFMGLLFIPMFILGAVLLIKDPMLLAKRLNSKEKETAQKQVISLSLVLFIVGFVLSSLDYRFGWSNMSKWVAIVGAMVLLISYGLYVEVMRENACLSRTVEIQENQKVIDTDLYGIIRHPMYFATTTLFLSFPIVLGSWVGFVIFLLLPVILAIRIKNEEKILEEGLLGYKEYKQKVKYRLLPFIW